MMKLINRLLTSSFWALLEKEFKQLLKNKAILILLTITPIVQILVYGLALSPDVNNLRLGVVDYANVNDSRELIKVMTSNPMFNLAANFTDENELSRQVEESQLDLGMVIPPDFSRKIDNNQAKIQIFIDSVNANTAGLANSYITQIIQEFNLQVQNKNSLPLSPQVIFLYNQGLESSWFFVPGVIGIILTLIGLTAGSLIVVQEKDLGTWEQLLISPATGWEILLAKILPLTLLMQGTLCLTLVLSTLIYELPIRGSILLFVALSILYILVNISLGLLLATASNSQQQVVLLSFFVNQPIIQASGILTPLEAMPRAFQIFALFNPLSHYMAIVRSILLRGVGLNALWIHIMALLAFLVIFLGLAIRRTLIKN